MSPDLDRRDFLGRGRTPRVIPHSHGPARGFSFRDPGNFKPSRMSAEVFLNMPPRERGRLVIESRILTIGFAAAALATGGALAINSEAKAAGGGSLHFPNCQPTDFLIGALDFAFPGPISLPKLLDEYSGPKLILGAYEAIDSVVKMDTRVEEISAAAAILGVNETVSGGISGLSKIVLEREKISGLSSRQALRHLLERNMHIYRDINDTPVYIHFSADGKRVRTQISEGQVCQILKPTNVIESIRTALKIGEWVASSPPPTIETATATEKLIEPAASKTPDLGLVGVATPTPEATPMIIGTSTPGEIGGPTVWQPPTLEQARVGRGGPLPEDYALVAETMITIVLRDIPKAATAGVVWNSGYGENFHTVFWAKAANGNFIWKEGGSLMAFDEYPMHWNEWQSGFIAGQSFFEIHDSKDAVLGFTGPSAAGLGEKPVLMKTAVDLANGRQEFLEYFDFTSGEWQMNPAVLQAMAPDGYIVSQDEGGNWIASGDNQALLQFDLAENVWLEALPPEIVWDLSNPEAFPTKPFEYLTSTEFAQQVLDWEAQGKFPQVPDTAVPVHSIDVLPDSGKAFLRDYGMTSIYNFTKQDVNAQIYQGNSEKIPYTLAGVWKTEYQGESAFFILKKWKNWDGTSGFEGFIYEPKSTNPNAISFELIDYGFGSKDRLVTGTYFSEGITISEYGNSGCGAYFRRSGGDNNPFCSWYFANPNTVFNKDFYDRWGKTGILSNYITINSKKVPFIPISPIRGVMFNANQ